MSRSPEPLGRAGGYRLLALVEERGLLATYDAEHESLGRRALVRATAPNVAPSPRLTDALLREARGLAKLRHEGLLALYEVIETPERVAVVMEHPLAPTLAEIEKTLSPRGGLGVDEAIAVILAVARAVAHAHARGFVHGRVGAGTVHLGPERGVVLAGYDRLRSVDDDVVVERAGLEPSQLSPEELMDERPTQASDVFALGVLAHEALTGKHPFGPPGPELAQRIRTERPSPIESARRVPADVERVVVRALSKQPGLRHADAGELVRDLEAALGREPPLSRHLSAMSARAGLGKAAAGVATAELDASAAPKSTEGRRLLDVIARLGGVLALMIALAVGIEVAERSGRPAAASTPASAAPGFVKILAHPWAEIWIDGVARDTTPVARPFELSAGRHTIVLKHPRAADERRVVDVAPGQVTTIDVEMRVVPVPVDAGVDASP